MVREMYGAALISIAPLSCSKTPGSGTGGWFWCYAASGTSFEFRMT